MGHLQLLVSSLSSTVVHYIASKQLGKAAATEGLSSLFKIVTTVAVDDQIVGRALHPVCLILKTLLPLPGAGRHAAPLRRAAPALAQVAVRRLQLRYRAGELLLDGALDLAHYSAGVQVLAWSGVGV